MLADSVNLFQIFISKFLVDDIAELFGNFWNICDRLEIVRVFSIVIGNLLAIRPYTNGRSCGIAVRFELLFTIAELRFLELHNDIGHHRTILVHDGNISAFDFATKMNREFDFNAACGITIFVNQLIKIKLTYSFFRL